MKCDLLLLNLLGAEESIARSPLPKATDTNKPNEQLSASLLSYLVVLFGRSPFSFSFLVLFGRSLWLFSLVG